MRPPDCSNFSGFVSFLVSFITSFLRQKISESYVHFLVSAHSTGPMDPTLMHCSLLCIHVILSDTSFFPATESVQAPSVMLAAMPQVLNPVPAPSTLAGFDCQNCGRFLSFKPCQSNKNGNRGHLVAIVHCCKVCAEVPWERMPKHGKAGQGDTLECSQELDTCGTEGLASAWRLRPHGMLVPYFRRTRLGQGPAGTRENRD